MGARWEAARFAGLRDEGVAKLAPLPAAAGDAFERKDLRQVDAWEIEARLSIQATMSRYTRFVDAGRPHELGMLFTEPMHYDMGGGRVVHSRAELTATVEEIKSTFRAAENFGRLRHHVSSVAIELTGPDRATATSYFLAMSAAGPDHWGVYRDELTRLGQDWLFARRVVTVEGASQTSPVRSEVRA
jgi:SnoaL-like domain